MMDFDRKGVAWAQATGKAWQNAVVPPAATARVRPGSAGLELIDVSSRLTTLDTLGSYRVSLTGDPANPGISQLSLSTQGGALQLSGSGTWGPGGVRFRGEASAGPMDEPALSNLLNIIGRRNGARSVISIG